MNLGEFVVKYPTRERNTEGRNTTMIENVTIVGMGALGILYDDLMERTLGPGHVRFIAEGERLTRLQQEGAWCNGRKCDFTVTDNTGEEAELLLFAVKMTALDEAMELAAPLVGEDTVILSLLNGVTSEEHIGQTFGPGKILYCVAQGMDAVREDNRLTYTQAGKLYLGLPEEDYFDRGEKLDAVLEFLQRAGVPAEREPGEILHHIWGKFMLNVGVNQVCMAYGCTYGQVQKPGEARDTMIAAMHEARKVGACQGVLVTQKDLYDYLALLDTMPSDAMPSMAQDALAHRPSEVEAFAGTVLELAKFYGMQAPVNQKLYDTIRETEANW